MQRKGRSEPGVAAESGLWILKATSRTIYLTQCPYTAWMDPNLAQPVMCRNLLTVIQKCKKTQSKAPTTCVNPNLAQPKFLIDVAGRLLIE